MDDSKIDDSAANSSAQKVISRMQARKEARRERLKNGLTMEALLATEDRELGETVMEYHFGERKAEKKVGLREWVAGMTPELRAVAVTSIVDGEVCNGGFCAVYYNSTHEIEAYFVEAFEMLGANEHVGLMRRAIELHREGKDKELGDLDKPYFALRRQKKLRDIHAEFIRGRMERFIVEEK